VCHTKALRHELHLEQYGNYSFMQKRFQLQQRAQSLANVYVFKKKWCYAAIFFISSTHFAKKAKSVSREITQREP
jgi:hypothetical protein